MNDLEHVLQEGRILQEEDGLTPPFSSKPSMRLWVCLAGVLVLISLGIELFWPLPVKKLPFCDASKVQQGAVSESCVLPPSQ